VSAGGPLLDSPIKNRTRPVSLFYVKIGLNANFQEGRMGILMEKRPTDLNQIPGLSSDLVSALESAWITTADQVVAVGATDTGKSALADLMGLSRREVEHLLDSARQVLPPDVRREMEEVVESDLYGKGAVPPPEEGRR
jgi:hypothetical protein